MTRKGEGAILAVPINPSSIGQMAPFQTLFVVATLLWTCASLYLSWRQSRFVHGHRDTVPADFVASHSLDAHRKAAAYAEAREKLARLETLVDSLVALAWAFGGIDVLYRWIAVLLPPSLGRGVAFLVAAGFVGAIAALPFDLWRTFRLERRFGFNRTNPKLFILDRLQKGAIALAIAIPMLFGLLWIMRTLTGLWWLWAWIALVAIMMLAPTVFVRFIAPRFNKFTPLADGALRTRIENLLTRSGFRSSGLFTMDASRRTAHGNAYFVGFGRTKRIILFDTLVANSQPDEIEAVVAHELGHDLHHHVIYGLLWSAATLFAAFAAFGWLTKQPWLASSFGVRSNDDAVGLFICLLLASVVGPLFAPIGNWISRRNEYQADDYACRTVGVEPMVRALTRLTLDNASTLTPDPLYSLVHHSHPTVPLRVRKLRATPAASSA